jgi:hypothetical protein
MMPSMQRKASVSGTKLRVITSGRVAASRPSSALIALATGVNIAYFRTTTTAVTPR